MNTEKSNSKQTPQHNKDNKPNPTQTQSDNINDVSKVTIDEKKEASNTKTEQATKEHQTNKQPKNSEKTTKTTNEAQIKIQQLEKELAQIKDQSLRAIAEAQNIKRRAQLDIEKAHKFALEKFASSLLPVMDSLEKGIESTEENEDNKTLLEGMNLTLKQLSDSLQKEGIEQLDPTGKPFDPHFHEAMTMVPNPDVKPNTVLQVIQKGYTLHSRVIRPVRVIVSQ